MKTRIKKEQVTYFTDGIEYVESPTYTPQKKYWWWPFWINIGFYWSSMDSAKKEIIKCIGNKHKNVTFHKFPE